MAIAQLKRIYKENNIFAFNLNFLCLVGLWPNREWPKSKLLLYQTYEITNHVLSILYLIVTGIGTYQHKNEVPVFLSNLDKSFVAYKFVIKSIVFITKRKELRDLIDQMVCSGDQIVEERKNMMSTHVISVTLGTTAIVGAFSALAQYEFEMTVEAWMPFDPMKNRLNLALAAQLIVVMFLVPCLYRACAMQGIVCSMIMYICDQLVDLQQRVRVLNYRPNDEWVFKEEFKNIVKKHVRIIGYTKTMGMIFKEYFLIQNLVISVELCLNAVMVTMVGTHHKKLLVSFLAFLIMALVNAYIYCYLGNELILQSQGIALASFEAEWTSWPVSLQKDLLLVIRAAQRPLALSAGGIVNMSIETFGKTLYNGYSIFAVLNDVVD